MANKKVLDLIKLEVLGCINETDRENLRLMKETEEDFPWNELAEYQNLVALLPSSLTVKYPESDLKDKTAMKLYNIRDEIKAKLEAKRLKDAPVTTIQEDNILVEEPPVDVSETEIKLTGEEKIVEEREEIPVQKNISEKTEPEVKEIPPPKATIDKEMVEKITREYVKAHYARELAAIQNNINTNKILTIAFFVVTLILIVLLFILK